MGWTIGIPSLKLNMVGNKSKHCGNYVSVAEEALAERKGHDPDINPELSAKNRYEGYKSAAELVAYTEKHCATMRDSLGRSLRKDAVRMCVTILKPPGAYMATLTEAEQQRFLQDGIDKITEIVGPKNIKSIAWHYDEQGPHVHVFWEPITSDGRLCAKEMHNLTLLGRLNREMPIFLREKGWDIDDCNAYDAAEEALKSEAEKAERRHKNGRSSAVYKAESEKELRSIRSALNTLQAGLEQEMKACVEQAVTEVVADQGNIYADALFLLHECDEARFEALSNEGRLLKQQKLKNTFCENDTRARLDVMIDNAKKHIQQLSWQERQEMWDRYRNISSEFWELRNELMEDYRSDLCKAYDVKRRADRSLYWAQYLLYRSRSILLSLVALVWALVSLEIQYQYEIQIIEVKKERNKLIRNTANFKTYSNAYREELKAGRMPYDGYLSSIRKVIEAMDQEERRFRRKLPQRTSLPEKTKDVNFRNK